MLTKQLKNKIIKQAGPLSKPEDENKPGFNEVDKAKEQYQKSKAKTEKSKQKEDKPKKENKPQKADKSKKETKSKQKEDKHKKEDKPQNKIPKLEPIGSNTSNFVQMLKNSGWKKTKNKSGKPRLQKVIKDYRIILSGPDISDLSFQSRSYSSKFTEFVANIICERTEAIDVTLMVLTKATKDKKSKVLKKFDLTLSLSTTEKAFNKKINQCLQRIPKVKAPMTSVNKNTVDVKAEEKNQSKQLSKDEMIDSILDKLSDEQYDILAKRYKILNMD